MGVYGAVEEVVGSAVAEADFCHTFKKNINITVS